MPELSTLVLFAVACALLVAIPGPAVLYVVAQSMHYGRVTGLVGVLGIGVGSLVHVAAAVIGLSSLIVSSALAFEIVKYAGAAYLVYVGARRLLARDESVGSQLAVQRSRRRVFTQGVVVNVLNPKTALFFMSLLPQFVDTSAGLVPLQMLVLGMTWVVVALAGDSVWALVAGTAGGLLRRSARARAVERYATGSIFVGLGLMTAAARRA